MYATQRFIIPTGGGLIYFCHSFDELEIPINIIVIIDSTDVFCFRRNVM